jgi:peptide/nickel transport system permease protein
MSEDVAESSHVERSGLWARLADSDALGSFLASPTTVAAGIITAALIAAAALAPWIAPTDPFNPAANFLSDALNPPRFVEGGDSRFLLGTDDQGRDLLSAILYGLRISLVIGGASVLLGAALGVTLGLVAGYAGGWLEAIIMRVADVQLTFPAILIALLVDGVAQPFLKGKAHSASAAVVLIVSIGLSFWVQYARTVRASTLVEKNRDYVNLALAIITEATLSFLGVGLPPTEPSLGTLIRIGENYLFSGEWWIVAFPSLALAILVLAVNMLGDWLRDALNPRLK